MKKVIVTGINGFVGHHLAKELSKNNITVIGTGMDRLLDPALSPYVEDYVEECDLTQDKDISRLPLHEAMCIINLAGLASVGASFAKSSEYIRINVAVHETIAKRILNEKLKLRMISVSSGAVYDTDADMPITEKSALAKDGSPYSISKIEMEKSLYAYQKKGLDIIIVRPFNHIGPGQLPGFLVPDLYFQIQNSIKANEPLSIGNLGTKRDYTDVRDVVRAYAMLATAKRNHLKHSIYNVCSEKSVSGTKILALILKYCNIKNIRTEIDPSKLRPNDPLDITGSNERIRSEINWKPTIEIEKTIADFISSQ
jgi:GDP-4-dehydro-6-deoxy-D-mannose reductase